MDWILLAYIALALGLIELVVAITAALVVAHLRRQALALLIISGSQLLVGLALVYVAFTCVPFAKDVTQPETPAVVVVFLSVGGVAEALLVGAGVLWFFPRVVGRIFRDAATAKKITGTNHGQL